LDTTVMTQAAATVSGTVVNGPEDDATTWFDIDWDQAEESVRRLRQRIFAATRAGDLKRVRNLQKLMLRSRANARLSVRRVTEINAGRLTAGIDGRVVVTAPDKADLAGWVQKRSKLWTARPVKRVFIVRREALRRIPCSAGRNLEGGFWIYRLTRCRKVDGTRACRKAVAW
jgi:RNA-directed DNA polymerase